MSFTCKVCGNIIHKLLHGKECPFCFTEYDEKHITTNYATEENNDESL